MVNFKMIYSYSLNSQEVNITKKEVYRYLGYGRVYPSDEVTALIDECVNEFNKYVNYRACYAKVDISVDEQNEITDFGFMQVKSHSLTINLRGCESAYIFAATTGAMAERLIMKHNKLSALKGIVTDAIGSASIEDFCNLLNKMLADLSSQNNKFLRPRFSCGYGDFPLEFQPQILEFLDTSRKICLNITDNLMMTPVKSVTAVVGISDFPTKCRTGCVSCEKTDCEYRK